MIIAYAVARPNFAKLASVIAAVQRRLPSERHVVVHTHQHHNRGHVRALFEQLGVVEPTIGSAWARRVTPCRRRTAWEQLEPMFSS